MPLHTRRGRGVAALILDQGKKPWIKNLGPTVHRRRSTIKRLQWTGSYLYRHRKVGRTVT